MSSGLHQFDGELPIFSQQTINARVAQLRASLAEAEGIDSATLLEQERFDRELLIGGLGEELFSLTEWQDYRHNPMALMYPLEVTNYMDRAYAPVEQRIASLAQVLRQVPEYLESLRSLLEPPFAEPILRQSIESYEGIAGFYRGDLSEFANANVRGALAVEVAESLDEAAVAVDSMVAYLKANDAAATNSFALGADVYAKMLRHGERVELPLADIEAAGERELSRNRGLAEQAAAAIAPGKSVADAIALVSKEHPTAESLLDETRALLEEIRAFVVDNDVATVASEVRATVRETPSFMRWAFAAMDGPGPFEQVATESFYYVTPVEGHWSTEEAEAWLRYFSYPILKIISVHEVYPGHYVHFLRHHDAPSDAAKVFGAYSFWEGWAHYCEEMVLEVGFGNGDPKLSLAVAQEALVRICRMLCSLRMHTQGLSLDDATRFFMANAYMEEMPASKEAQRGTFDPGYLNYTLGKLMIYKLRADWQAEQGSAYSLKAFHDDLLSHGGPPVPLLRKFMLRSDDGRVL